MPANEVKFLFDIKLPTLNWFMFKNVYSGSLRTDPTKPILECTTFNYKVRIIDTKNGTKLLAMYWFEFPWNQAANMIEATAGELEASDFGLEVAENWLKSNFIKEIKYGFLISNKQQLKMLSGRNLLIESGDLYEK